MQHLFKLTSLDYVSSMDHEVPKIFSSYLIQWPHQNHQNRNVFLLLCCLPCTSPGRSNVHMYLWSLTSCQLEGAGATIQTDNAQYARTPPFFGIFLFGLADYVPHGKSWLDASFGSQGCQGWVLASWEGKTVSQVITGIFIEYFANARISNVV